MENTGHIPKYTEQRINIIENVNTKIMKKKNDRIQYSVDEQSKTVIITSKVTCGQIIDRFNRYTDYTILTLPLDLSGLTSSIGFSEERPITLSTHETGQS